MSAYQCGKLRTAMWEMIVWLHCRVGLGLLLMYRKGFSWQQYQLNNDERQLTVGTQDCQESRVGHLQDKRPYHSNIPHLISKQT